MPRAILAACLALLAAGAAWVALRTPEPAPPVPVERHAFRVAQPPASEPAVVWAVGDGADGSARSRRIARLIAADDPTAVLYLGDVYEKGTREDFEEKLRAPYGPLLGRMLPTPGNHEWPRHTTGYDPFWKSVTGRPTAPWYATRVGGWQVVSLNSEAPHGGRSAQLRWLRRQVHGGGTCRIAMWHRPRFSAGRKHGDQPDTQPFWDAVRGRAALVLSGHDHNLQRFEPREGTVQIVSGAGGRERHRLRDDDRLAFGTDDQHGAVRLTLHRAAADVAFVAKDGRVLDRSRVRCRRS